jgi:hypothetical protein
MYAALIIAAAVSASCPVTYEAPAGVKYCKAAFLDSTFPPLRKSFIVASIRIPISLLHFVAL